LFPPKPKAKSPLTNTRNNRNKNDENKQKKVDKVFGGGKYKMFEGTILVVVRETNKIVPSGP